MGSRLKMCEVNDENLICGSESNAEISPKKKCVPTQTQIREQMGSRLSEVFFENLCSEARTWLGITPPLIGPDAVWISPEARLNKDVALRPVPEPAVVHLKGLVHGSILEVGQKYIDLLENKHRLEMEAALGKQAIDLEEEWKRKLGDTGSGGAEGLGACKKVVATLMEHFERCFDDLVETCHLQMRKECQKRVEAERSEISAYMLAQLQDEIARRDYELCSEFHDILQNELNVLAARFIQQIDNEREIAIRILQNTIAKYEKMLADLKTEMELSSVVDICRAITNERVDCNERMRKMQAEKRKGTDQLLKLIDDLKAENCTLQKMSTERLKRLMTWRKKLRVLLQEFQRFINFAMSSVPGQSEFLLSVDKLMFKEFPEDTFIQPEDYKHYKDCLKDKLQLTSEEQPILDFPSDKSTPEESSRKSQPGETPSTASYDEICCPTHLSDNKTECELNFDYDQFKKMLVDRFARDIRDPREEEKKKKKKTVCLWKKRSKGKPLDKSNEWYQQLTLVGETEKQHKVPVECFLRKRLKTVLKVCNDDPEFAKLMLGCEHV